MVIRGHLDFLPEGEKSEGVQPETQTLALFSKTF